MGVTFSVIGISFADGNSSAGCGKSCEIEIKRSGSCLPVRPPHGLRFRRLSLLCPAVAEALPWARATAGKFHNAWAPSSAHSNQERPESRPPDRREHYETSLDCRPRSAAARPPETNAAQSL